MTASADRTAADLLRLQATFLVLERLQRYRPALVIARGSAATFAHAPATARVPNDLDVFWLGDIEQAAELAHAVGAASDVEVSQIKLVMSPDPRISALHRLDVRVWLQADGPRPDHRLWLDVSTSRRVVPAVDVRLDLTGRDVMSSRVVPLYDLLAEKLWVYEQSTRGERADLRWTDLCDMLALAQGAAALADGTLGELRSASARYFSHRGGVLPRHFLPPPPEWRSPWYRLVGPVAAFAPTLDVAWEAAAGFWQPVLRGDVEPGVRWHPSRWAWDDGARDVLGTSRLLVDQRQHRFHLRTVGPPFVRSGRGERAP